MNQKFIAHSTAFHGYGFAFSLLFREHGSNGQASEFQFCLNPKKTLTTGNQGTVEREADISGFDRLDDFIFTAGITQFQFVFKIESCFGIVVEIKTDFITDAGVQAHIDVFFEIKVHLTAQPFRRIGIVCSIAAQTEFQSYVSRRAQVNGMSAENFIKSLSSDIDRGDNAVAIACSGSRRTLFPILFQGFIHIYFAVIAQIKVGRRAVFERTYLGDDFVEPCFRVILHLCLQTVRIAEIHRVAAIGSRIEHLLPGKRINHSGIKGVASENDAWRK